MKMEVNTVEVGVHEAKTTLSKLIERAIMGDKIIITRSGEPVIRLEPIPKKLKKRIPGRSKGKMWIADDFDKLPDDFMTFFE